MFVMIVIATDVIGSFCVCFKARLVRREASWCNLGLSGSHLGAFWVRLGAILTRLGAILKRFSAILGPTGLS